MFKKLTQYFGGSASLEVDAKGKPTSRDLQLATAVLLLEMAGRDSDYAPDEIKAVAEAIRSQFRLADQEVVSFLEQADALRSQNQKIDRFVEAINANFSVAQRQRIMAMIFHVARADQRIDVTEQRFSLQLKNRLHLTDEQVEEAKTISVNLVEEAPADDQSK